MDGIDSKRLRYFARIAQDGSLTKAAGVLGIAQPALSRQMRMLEEELGTSLFSRTARGMRLTEEGEYLLASISGPLRELDLAFRNIRAAATKVEGDFAIGMPTGVNHAIGKDLALRMHARYPDMRLKFVEGVTGSLLDWLMRGMIDFAVLETPSRDERFEDIPLLSAPLKLVGPPICAGETSAPITFANALKLPLILPSHHLGTRNILNAAAAAAHLPLVARFETDSPRLALDLVENGMGYAVLPDLFVPKLAGAGSVTNQLLRDPILHFELHMSTRKRTGLIAGHCEAALKSSVADLLNSCGPQIA